MKYLRKKLLSFILALSFILSYFPVYANYELGPEWSNGYLQYECEVKKGAVENIRYRTVGWIMTTTNSNGNPKSVHYVEFNDMENKGDRKAPTPGNVISRFEVGAKKAEDKIIQVKKKFSEDYIDVKEGTITYISPVYRLIQPRQTEPSGKRYYSKAEILAAAPWSVGARRDLENSYDKKVPYHARKMPMDKQIIINGAPMAEKIQTKHIGDYGLGTKQFYGFDAYITLKDGRRAKLIKTYKYKKSTGTGKPIDVVTYAEPKKVDLATEIPLGGITVVGEYELEVADQIPVIVEHFDMATNTVIETEGPKMIKPGDPFTAKKKVFDGLTYLDNVYKKGTGGWTDPQTDEQRVFSKVLEPITIRFNYRGDFKLFADLIINANPSEIEKGKTARVDFTLNASKSEAEYGIKNYEFWLSDNPEEWGSSIASGKNALTNKAKSNVEAGSTWYGKVEITDNKGKKAEATAEITLGTLKPKVEVKPELNLDFVWAPQDIKMTTEMDSEPATANSTGFGKVKFKLPSKYKNKEFDVSVVLDGSGSSSTNGIEWYKFHHTGAFKKDHYDSVDKTMTKNYIRGSETSHEEYVVMKPGVMNSSTFYLEIKDSGEEGKKASAFYDVYYEFEYTKSAPKVSVGINKEIFSSMEVGHFTTSFVDGGEEYFTIKDKYWVIKGKDNEVVLEGFGELPKDYEMSMPEGNYTATQFGTYDDEKGIEHVISDSVDFKIVPIADPDVKLSCDKEKYVVPKVGKFKPELIESFYTYAITEAKWQLKTSNGVVVDSGEGEFPHEYEFKDTLNGGDYIAEQTIYWDDYGKLKTKTATCKFRLISPKPAVDFRVDMKMSNEPTWNRIDVQGESGKQFKHIKIDLSPSIKLNEALENPYPINFTSSNTQIKVVALTKDGKEDTLKNNKIHTPNKADKKIIDDTVTFQGKQSIDVRFDDFGKYRIKARVANGHYISNWISKDIVVREDLPPKVFINFEDVIIEDSKNKVYRDIDNLKVKFKVKAKTFTQDEDKVNPESAKLQMRFDYNADNDTSNDNEHSNMMVSKYTNTLQPYVTIRKNESMDMFDVEMYSNDFPILGKIRFEYFIGETPTIPNFTEGTMPTIPEVLGSTLLQPIEEKLIWADNKPGNIKVEVGKESKIEIDIIMGTDTLYFDLNTLKSYYGNDAKIYIVDKNGNRELIN